MSLTLNIFYIPFFKYKLLLGKSKSIKETNLWKSLNFINYLDITSFTKKNNANVLFYRGLIYKMFLRIKEDPLFASRHKILLFFINFIEHLGLLKILRILPPILNTPMVFNIKKK